MARHYAHAPISEAVIDLRIEASESPPTDPFSNFVSGVQDRYPFTAPIRAVEMGFHVEDGAGAKFHNAQQVVGERLQSTTGDRVLQVQQLGFTLSHMAPYTNWEAFREEARHVWPLFVKATQAKAVSRVAVRVINKLIVPFTEAHQFTTVMPSIPPGPFGSLDAYFMQLQIGLETVANGCKAIVNIARGNAEDGSNVEYVLDFDLFVAGLFPAESAELWRLLDKMSAAKNDLFEASITDKTRELIS
jgi:uncharacterized protein (TIGR04255 family)